MRNKTKTNRASLIHFSHAKLFIRWTECAFCDWPADYYGFGLLTPSWDPLYTQIDCRKYFINKLFYLIQWREFWKYRFLLESTCPKKWENYVIYECYRLFLFRACFKTSARAKPFMGKWIWVAWKWTFRGIMFSYEQFGTKTCFDAEAKWSIQAYFLFHMSLSCPECLVLPWFVKAFNIKWKPF